MSRKNHNARPNINASAQQKAIHVKLSNTDSTRIRMLNEHCGVEFDTLYSTMIESDTSYQRDIKMNRVNKIVENFDPRLVNPLKISFREGHYYVFDGAHTLAALKKIHKFENFPVMCMIFHGLTYADEAYLFALQRGESQDVASAARIKALIISGDAAAIDFEKRVTDVGFKIAYKSSSAMNTMGCVDKMWRKYNEDPEIFSEALSLLKACWHGEHWSLAANIFGGIFVFLKACKKNYSRDRFIKSMEKADPRTLAKNRSDIGSMDSRYAFAMIKLYNKGSKKGSLNPYMLYDEVA